MRDARLNTGPLRLVPLELHFLLHGHLLTLTTQYENVEYFPHTFEMQSLRVVSLRVIKIPPSILPTTVPT
jgi:hypothetical protein